MLTRRRFLAALTAAAAAPAIPVPSVTVHRFPEAGIAVPVWGPVGRGATCAQLDAVLRDVYTPLVRELLDREASAINPLLT